jgi:hypothetical protein
MSMPDDVGVFNKKEFNKLFNKGIMTLMEKYKGNKISHEIFIKEMRDFLTKINGRALTSEEIEYLYKNLKRPRPTKQPKKRHKVPSTGPVATTPSIVTTDPRFAEKIAPILSATEEKKEEIKTDNGELNLFENQQALVNFMRWHTRHGNTKMQSQGIMVKHGLGSGKTLTSLSIAQAIQDESMAHSKMVKKHVIIMTPASLRFAPWMKEIVNRNYQNMQAIDGKDAISKLEDQHQYYFINYNGYGVLNKRIQELSRKLKGVYGEEIHNPFDNSICIIDEVQNFTNTIRNEWENSKTFIRNIYHMLVTAHNAKMILLSGTPIVNDAIEACYQINILRGAYIFPLGTQDNYRAFHRTFFCKYGNATILLNTHLFRAITSGIYSYYRGNVSDVPTQYKMKKYFISMAKNQGMLYGRIEDRTEAEMKSNRNSAMANIATLRRGVALNARGSLAVELGIKVSSIGEEKADNGLIFTALMRMISNVYWSTDTRNKLGVGETIPRYVEYTHQALVGCPEFKNPRRYSPKVYQLLKNADNEVGRNSPIVIYSNYQNMHGLGYIAGVLRERGYKEYDGTGDLEAGVQHFVRWTGAVNNKNRMKLLSVINDTTNKHGAIVKFILITAAAKEGVEFYNCRQIHILEPQWNISSLRQIIGRCVRIRSHHSLPPEERNVQPYIYISSKLRAKSKRKETVKAEMCIDEIIHEVVAREKEKRISPIERIVHSNALDCHVHGKVNVKVECYGGDDDRTVLTTNADLRRAVASAISNSTGGVLKQITYKGEKYLARTHIVYANDTIAGIAKNGINRVGTILGDKISFDDATKNKMMRTPTHSNSPKKTSVPSPKQMSEEKVASPAKKTKKVKKVKKVVKRSKK